LPALWLDGKMPYAIDPMFNEEEKRVISQEIAEMNAKTATEAN
jgi:hypothetical protein